MVVCRCYTDDCADCHTDGRDQILIMSRKMSAGNGCYEGENLNPRCAERQLHNKPAAERAISHKLCDAVFDLFDLHFNGCDSFFCENLHDCTPYLKLFDRFNQPLIFAD